MSEKKRVLVCEFHQESNTFNPIVARHDYFLNPEKPLYGKDLYARAKDAHTPLGGIIKEIEAAGGEPILTFSLWAPSGGRLDDRLVAKAKELFLRFYEEAAPIDAVCLSLHGATCSETCNDVCGEFVEYIRSIVGEETPIASQFDLHANITPRLLRNTDIVCGYQTYPHVDLYETGSRAARLCMEKLAGKPVYLAATHVPMLTPPSGYTSLEEPFKSVIDSGKALIADGTLKDFTVFNVQPWLDIDVIASTAVAIADSPEAAKAKSRELAQKLFDVRDGCWPDLMTIDEVIDRAEARQPGEPVVVLSDAADSPNGGAVGDSVAVALRIRERGSRIYAAMFVKDAEAAARAFEVGVGNTAEFTIGAKITPNAPGPFRAEGTVISLHTGDFYRSGKTRSVAKMGPAAVVRFGNMDILLCDKPTSTGDPQIFRGFGIEPSVYDLIVVKANTSFRAPYSKFTTHFCMADTPGVGAANLHHFHWEHLPKGMYPFDLPENYEVEDAVIWRG